MEDESEFEKINQEIYLHQPELKCEDIAYTET